MNSNGRTFEETPFGKIVIILFIMAGAIALPWGLYILILLLEKPL